MFAESHGTRDATRRRRTFAAPGRPSKTIRASFLLRPAPGGAAVRLSPLAVIPVALPAASSGQGPDQQPRGTPDPAGGPVRGPFVLARPRCRRAPSPSLWRHPLPRFAGWTGTAPPPAPRSHTHPRTPRGRRDRTTPAQTGGQKARNPPGPGPACQRHSPRRGPRRLCLCGPYGAQRRRRRRTGRELVTGGLDAGWVCGCASC